MICVSIGAKRSVGSVGAAMLVSVAIVVACGARLTLPAAGSLKVFTAQRSTFNIIQTLTNFKVDVFIQKSRPFDLSVLLAYVERYTGSSESLYSNCQKP